MELQVKVFSPYQNYFEGKAQSVSARNAKGPFDVLPGHTDFFSLLDGGKVLINTGQQNLEIPIERGLIKVDNDVVTVFANV